MGVLYSRVLYSTCYIHVLYSVEYVLYIKKCHKQGVLYSIICFIAWYILMLYIMPVSYIAFNIACSIYYGILPAILHH